MQANLQLWWDWLGKGQQDGWVTAMGDALTPEGKVVNADKSVTDGPYTEAKELVGGFSMIEAENFAPAEHWKILGTNLKTQFSNNIRNNFGFLNRCAPEGVGATDKLFVQEGRKVFKEVVPMVAKMIIAELERLELEAPNLRRMWLHQANANMNRLIASKVLGREATADESPTVLDTYANTSSAGSIIAFHKHSEDMTAGDKGLICSFGAGYSAGTVFVEKAA